MNEITDKLHLLAMELAETAFTEKQKGNVDKALSLFREAYIKEAEAAFNFKNDIDYEPTRSVLYRSAASLALQCNMLRESEILVATALAGNPPEEIAEELRDLLEQLSFQRHLDIRGLKLSSNELELAIWGGSLVGYGIASYNTLMQKMDLLAKFIYRTIERIKHIPFRESGSVSREVLRDYEIFVTTPAPGSFCMTMQIGNKTPMLPGFDDASEIVSEVVGCLDVVNSRNIAELSSRIPDEQYRDNCISLTRHLTPRRRSTENLRISAPTAAGIKSVVLQPSTEESVRIRKRSHQSSEYTEVYQGELQQASSIPGPSGKWGKVTLVDDNSKQITIHVPITMMADIVRPHYETKVEIIVSNNSGMLILKEISEMKD